MPVPKKIFMQKYAQRNYYSEKNFDLAAGIESFLRIACEHLTVLKDIIHNFGHLTLSEYLRCIEPQKHTSMQAMDDLLDVIVDYIQPLLGKPTAYQAAEDIENTPIVLTANHHGVMYFAQDFQGSLIFSLNNFGIRSAPSTVPVFSCGTVPLDNLTYPLGLLFYRIGHDNLDAVPQKVPLFPNKVRRQLVSHVTPFDEHMIIRARKRVTKLVQDQAICASLATAADQLLLMNYGQSEVLNRPSYSQQSVILNHAIWQKLHNESIAAPTIISLELEQICTALLMKDLVDPDSLAFCIMFDANLRKNVFQELDGKRACWQTKLLLKRLHAGSMEKTRQSAAKGCGTMLFWGVDDRGRRVPLYIDTDGSKQEMLRGICDRGKDLEIPYSPESILEQLRLRKILPSIFTSFLVISLARGIVCAGGYFQCEYLPAMQRGVVKALIKSGGYDLVARQISKVTTDTYLSGMIGVMTNLNHDYLIPAGPAEIMAGGGFQPADIEKLQSLTVKDAHLGALGDTLQDLPAETMKNPNWKTNLAATANDWLQDKVVLK